MGQSDRPLAHLGSIEQDILNHQFCVNAWSTKGKKIRSFVYNQNRTKLSQVKFLDRNKERDGKQELRIRIKTQQVSYSRFSPPFWLAPVSLQHTVLDSKPPAEKFPG